MLHPTGIGYRAWITVLNFLFPPLAVMLLAGPGYDCFMNCCLFFLAVIPSHIHGFYISHVFFKRRHKVKNGKYPGGKMSFIESKNVLNGGASPREVELLYMKEYGVGRSSSRRGSRGSIGRSGSKRSEMAMRRDGSQMRRSPAKSPGRSPSVRSNASRAGYGGSPVYDDRVARDGYGPPQRMGSRRGYA